MHLDKSRLLSGHTTLFGYRGCMLWHKMYNVILAVFIRNVQTISTGSGGHSKGDSTMSNSLNIFNQS